MVICPGDPVVITDAAGQEHPAVAVSPVYRGRDMPLVAVQFGDSDPIPWPAESVRAAQEPLGGAR